MWRRTKLRVGSEQPARRTYVCCFIPSSDLCRRLAFGRKRCASLSVRETSCLLPAARADRVRRSTVVAGGRARYSEHVDPRFPSSSSSLLSSSLYVYFLVFFISISLSFSLSICPSHFSFFLENIAIFKRKWCAVSFIFDLWHPHVIWCNIKKQIERARSPICATCA